MWTNHPGILLENSSPVVHIEDWIGDNALDSEVYAIKSSTSYSSDWEALSPLVSIQWNFGKMKEVWFNQVYLGRNRVADKTLEHRNAEIIRFCSSARVIAWACWWSPTRPSCSSSSSSTSKQWRFLSRCRLLLRSTEYAICHHFKFYWHVMMIQ